jgi:hypothetical protein
MDSFNKGKQIVLLNKQVFRSQQEQNFFSSPKPPIDSPPNFVLTALRGFSSEVNCPQHEADYPLFQVLILIIRYITLFPLYGIMLWTEIFTLISTLTDRKLRIALLMQAWIFYMGPCSADVDWGVLIWPWQVFGMWKTDGSLVVTSNWCIPSKNILYGSDQK